MLGLADVIQVAALLFGVLGFLWTGIQGMRGRSFWLPNRGGITGKVVEGTTARVVGFVFVVIALLMLAAIGRMLVSFTGT
jgi:hypothetical protein